MNFKLRPTHVHFIQNSVLKKLKCELSLLLKLTRMSLTNRLGREEESIVLSIWVVHSESFKGRLYPFFDQAGVVTSMTHVSFPVYLVLFAWWPPLLRFTGTSPLIGQTGSEARGDERPFSRYTMSTWVRYDNEKFRKSHEPKFSVIIHLVSCLLTNTDV